MSEIIGVQQYEYLPPPEVRRLVPSMPGFRFAANPKDGSVDGFQELEAVAAEHTVRWYVNRQQSPAPYSVMTAASCTFNYDNGQQGLQIRAQLQPSIRILVADDPYLGRSLSHLPGRDDQLSIAVNSKSVTQLHSKFTFISAYCFGATRTRFVDESSAVRTKTAEVLLNAIINDPITNNASQLDSTRYSLELQLVPDQVVRNFSFKLVNTSDETGGLRLSAVNVAIPSLQVRVAPSWSSQSYLCELPSYVCDISTGFENATPEEQLGNNLFSHTSPHTDVLVGRSFRLAEYLEPVG